MLSVKAVQHFSRLGLIAGFRPGFMGLVSSIPTDEMRTRTNYQVHHMNNQPCNVRLSMGNSHAKSQSLSTAVLSQGRLFQDRGNYARRWYRKQSQRDEFKPFVNTCSVLLCCLDSVTSFLTAWMHGFIFGRNQCGSTAVVHRKAWEKNQEHNAWLRHLP